MMRSNYQTQWAGQFGVAHELTRRGYLVTFTSGNAPGDDLLCSSPSGNPFSIQVKSLRSKTYFLYQPALLGPKPLRFFVFVYIPPDLVQAPEYFVMNYEQFLHLAEEQQAVSKKAEIKRGKPYADFAPGINYGVIARTDFRNAWHNFPV